LTINEIIVTNRIPKEAILCGEVNTILRIAKKNKWSPGSIFELKFSYKDKESIKVVIEESKEQVAKYISEEVLYQCFFKTRGKFREYWEEKWYQRWDARAWVVKFKVTYPVLYN